MIKYKRGTKARYIDRHGKHQFVRMARNTGRALFLVPEDNWDRGSYKKRYEIPVFYEDLEAKKVAVDQISFAPKCLICDPDIWVIEKCNYIFATMRFRLLRKRQRIEAIADYQAARNGPSRESVRKLWGEDTYESTLTPLWFYGDFEALRSVPVEDICLQTRICEALFDAHRVETVQELLPLNAAELACRGMASGAVRQVAAAILCCGLVEKSAIWEQIIRQEAYQPPKNPWEMLLSKHNQHLLEQAELLVRKEHRWVEETDSGSE